MEAERRRNRGTGEDLEKDEGGLRSETTVVEVERETEDIPARTVVEEKKKKSVDL